jgi:hypothetical protein
MASLRASLLLAAVLCALAASSASAARDLRSRRTQFVVRGSVWCDTCRAGFETPASTYIAGRCATSISSLPWIYYGCINFTRVCLSRAFPHRFGVLLSYFCFFS